MKKYNITVNGTTYEVIVEEVDGASHAPVYTAPTAPVAASTTPKAAPTVSFGANKGSNPDILLVFKQATKTTDQVGGFI